MEQPHLFPDWHYEIKAAFRRLVKKAGGVEAVALIPGMAVSKSTISNWQNPDMPALPALAVVVLIEQDVGASVVTGMIAAWAAEPARVPEDPLVSLSACIAEVGDVARVVHDAVADDVITETEKRRIFTEIDEAIAALQSLKTSAGGGA